METISSSVWQRKGSSIVFDQKSLGPFIAEGAVVSLRTALSWTTSAPSVPPVAGRTIVVSGLETALETLESQEAEEFLVNRIRTLVISLQSQWTECGLVFGFSSPARAFQETSMDEEVLFRQRDGSTVRLSDGLWDGTATVNMKRVVREGDRAGEEVVVGYYVARIS